ncbi:MAG: thiamine phosphate synthase [Rhodobiaceae bacterium]|nr:thiamine phosphate synthase [Rhodobiaceae bacterium]
MNASPDNAAEPRIVLFAPADRLAALQGGLEGLAAIVVTDGAEALEDGVRANLRAAGIPVLKKVSVAERAQGFDGLHVAGNAGELKAARKALPAGAMLGAGDARTRHAAMQLGEAMPDYVLLGRIATADPTDGDIAADADLVSWWAELFELPAVAVAGELADVADLAGAGADFVAVNRLVWSSDDPAATLVAVAGAIAASPARQPAEQDA